MLRLTLIGFTVTLMSCSQPLPPERPASVPHSATWAGGVDGGSWFVCQPRSQAPEKSQAFDCTIYNDFTGNIEAKGTFLPGSPVPDSRQFRPVGPITLPLEILAYDGRVIHLKSRALLVPDGVIDHPFDVGWGKFAEYKFGLEVSEREYGVRPKKSANPTVERAAPQAARPSP